MKAYTTYTKICLLSVSVSVIIFSVMTQKTRQYNIMLSVFVRASSQVHAPMFIREMRAISCLVTLNIDFSVSADCCFPVIDKYRRVTRSYRINLIVLKYAYFLISRAAECGRQRECKCTSVEREGVAGDVIIAFLEQVTRLYLYLIRKNLINYYIYCVCGFVYPLNKRHNT